MHLARRLAVLLALLVTTAALLPAASGPVSAASATVPATTPPAYSGSYPQLVNSYAFTGTTIGKQWSVYNSAWTGDPTKRDPSLVTVGGGLLHVTSTGARSSGLCLCGPGGKSTSPYGGWEIRARADSNADHGFAMLLWPNAEDWPQGGEIDIAEFNPARTKVTFTVHYDTANLQQLASRSGDFTDWHTYRVDWSATAIRYYIDGFLLASITDPAAIPHRAMHLCLQAGSSGHAPSATSASLDVAWVKTYGPSNAAPSRSAVRASVAVPGRTVRHSYTPPRGSRK